VTLPSVGEAGILAWTAPGFDLNTIPFEDYVRSVRVLPIVNLPKLEKTLSAAAASAPAKGRTK
ncbi:MAG: hypothetical protein ABFD86_18280, partial [Bryobacteraceae bacterium]